MIWVRRYFLEAYGPTVALRRAASETKPIRCQEEQLALGIPQGDENSGDLQTGKEGWFAKRRRVDSLRLGSP